MILAPIGTFCISVLLIYFWMAFPILFEIPIGCIPTFFNTPFGFPNALGLVWHLEVKNFFIGLLDTTSFTLNSIVLLKINTTIEFVLLMLFFIPFIPYLIIGLFNFLLFRLTKEAEFRTLLTTFRGWKLPPSNRYKTYGEAKNRIRQIIKNGSIKERAAIFLLFTSYFLIFIVLVLYLFSLSGILSIGLLTFNFVFLPVLLFMLFSQWFLWNSIR